MDVFCKGCICLDIDGTLTADPHEIPREVIQLLKALYAKGWQLLFVTGRTFSFASKVFEEVDFPFFFAVQNGADLLRMPEKKLVARSYLPAQMIAKLDEVYRPYEEDFIIYAGYEVGDFCYYRPRRFSEKMLEHLEVIRALSPEPWKEVEEFSFSNSEAFPLVKCFGEEEQAKQVHDSLSAMAGVQACYIKDPLSTEGVHLNLVTAQQATKGHVLRKLRSLLASGIPFIAAGDDRNDWNMLQEADIAILMKTAPKEMYPVADILAGPAEEMGIIPALLQATGERL